MAMPDKAHATRLRKMRIAARLTRRALPAHLPPALALTDPTRVPDPAAYATDLSPGTGLIYRHFGAPDRYHQAHALYKIAQERGLILLVANDPVLARDVGAAGVHWSERRIGEARKWKTRFALMTGAAHSGAAVKRAVEAGLDAALLSTVFPSASQSAGPPMGGIRFRAQAIRAEIPIYALGGINAENIGSIARYGGGAAVASHLAIQEK